MSVKIRIKRNRLYLDIIVNRKHHWESLHMRLESDEDARREQLRTAHICRARRELELLSGEWDLQRVLFPKKTLAEYCRDLVPYQQSKSRKKSIRALVACLSHFERGGVQLRDVSEDWVRAFSAWLFSETTLSVSTVKNYFGLLKTVLNNAVKAGLLKKNPASSVRLSKTVHSEKPALCASEVKRLFATAVKSGFETECKRAFLFSCVTALRYSDLATLEWQDISEKNGIFWLKKTQVKTQNPVEIPLGTLAVRLLGDIKESGFVFDFSKAYCTSLVFLNNWAQSAGVRTRIGWHTARRTFATLALESGVDVFTIQRLMGHTKITTTALYAKSDGLKQSAMQKLSDSLAL